MEADTPFKSDLCHSDILPSIITCSDRKGCSTSFLSEAKLSLLSSHRPEAQVSPLAKSRVK